MIEQLLKAKHWHIFIIIFGMPLFLELVTLPLAISKIGPLVMMKVLPVITILFTGGFLVWFWSIGAGLQSKVPNGVTMKVKRFKIFLIIPLIYLVLVSIYISSLYNGTYDNGQMLDIGLMGGMIWIVLLLHLFSTFCIIYSFYFAAKTFKTVELQREVSFSDFAGEFLLLWFFPIGIWIIQPKINKMIE